MQTINRPPPYGSLRESVLLRLTLLMEEIEHAKYTATLQMMVDKQSGIEAFRAYFRLAFPYATTQEEQRSKEMLKMMEAENNRGLIGVSKIRTPVVKSRLRVKYVDQKAVQRSDSLLHSIGSEWRP